ncbi:MAG: ATP-binding protein [Bacilli bacterium]|nr:ATP-binding protein [Bacilli bacterium]
MWILIILGLLMLWIIIGNLRQKPGNSFDIYFGVPGSGKTTFAAYLAKKRIKKKGRVLSNVSIKGTYEVERSDIGHYMIQDCLLLIDEAGIDYNNRNFSDKKEKMSKEEIYFYKYHRHYNVDIAIFSQGYDDMDKKLRTLATRYYIVKRSIFPGFITRKLINKRLGIDKNTKQIIDEYAFAILGTKWIYCPKLWKMFNSCSYKEMPTKEFEKY